MKKIIWIVIVLILLSAGYGLYRWQAKGKAESYLSRTSALRGAGREAMVSEESALPVEVTEVERGDMSATISVTGTIRPKKEVSVVSKVSGRVEAVTVEEGDRVSAGQVLIRLDPTEIASQVNQAKAALAMAKARLAQAKAGATLQTTQTSTAIEQAEAALVAAKARLTVIKTGARAQERKQAENAVATAKANLDNASSNYNRMQALFSQGAISKQQLDIAQMQYDIAKAQYDSAKQQLELIQIGARPEDIQAAEQQVKQAEAALELAKASKDQDKIRKEDIEVAKAGVEQAKAALEFAQMRLDNTVIRAPISGVVAYRAVNVGELVASGEMMRSPLLMIVDNSIVYMESSVSEEQIKQVKRGLLVKVTVDALPNRSFTGRVTEINPAADPHSRAFKVKISLPNPGGELQSGMFARGEIIIQSRKNCLVIPKDAVVSGSEKPAVFVLVGNKARKREIQLGLADVEKVEIISGLKLGEIVVTAGQSTLKENTPVRIVKKW